MLSDFCIPNLEGFEPIHLEPGHNALLGKLPVSLLHHAIDEKWFDHFRQNTWIQRPPSWSYRREKLGSFGCGDGEAMGGNGMFRWVRGRS